MSMTYLQRRIWWGTNSCLVDFGSRTKPEIVNFVWKPTADSKGKSAYSVLWDGVEFEVLSTVTAVKLWIISTVYDFKPGMLIPSALLFTAELSYIDRNLWVDNCNSYKDGSFGQEIISTVDGVKIPEYRMLHVGNPPARHSSSKTGSRFPPSHTAPSAVSWAQGQTEEETTTQTSLFTPTKKHWPAWKPRPPTDGSNFSEVPLDWEDFSWEARTNKAVITTLQPRDEDCIFILECAEEEISENRP